MTKKYRVKDIAELAGVSAGTVDRVLHNRGDVSEESRAKVEQTLESINYQPNIHRSSIGVKRKYRLLAVLPQFVHGEYWEQIENGIRKAIYEFSHLNLNIEVLYYDQFDLFSCRSTFSEAAKKDVDAMIVGPTFHDETMHFTNILSSKGIPYVFVDVMVDNTDPLAFYGPDSFASGYVEARLLLSIIERGADIALFQARRVGDESSTQVIARKYGFMAYLKDHSPDTKVAYGYYYNSDPARSWEAMDKFFAENPNIGGGVVFNSRAYIVSGYFREKGIKNIRLVGCATIPRNVEDLRAGYIDCLIAERPEYQGYMAVKATLEYLLYNKQPTLLNFTPIDILIKENIDCYINTEMA